MSLHLIYSHVQDLVYIGIRNQSYTDHYSVLIHRCPYMSVYLSVYVMYTGSLHPLIFVNSRSAWFYLFEADRQSFWQPSNVKAEVKSLSSFIPSPKLHICYVCVCDTCVAIIYFYDKCCLYVTFMWHDCIHVTYIWGDIQYMLDM